MKNSIYFIAILPNQEIQDEVNTFKRYAAEKFNTKRALTSPPHITLVPPFRYKDENIGNEVGKQLEKHVQQTKEFEIELKDFNCFAPRVIYVDVINNEVLNQLQKSLNTVLEKQCRIPFEYKEQAYHPHMTVAFKDLKESMFPKAWKYFRRAKYKQTFNATELILLKHNGKEWEVFDTFPFQ